MPWTTKQLKGALIKKKKERSTYCTQRRLLKAALRMGKGFLINTAEVRVTSVSPPILDHFSDTSSMFYNISTLSLTLENYLSFFVPWIILWLYLVRNILLSWNTKFSWNWKDLLFPRDILEINKKNFFELTMQKKLVWRRTPLLTSSLSLLILICKQEVIVTPPWICM